MKRKPNKEINYTCSCGKEFSLKKSSKNPKCPDCTKVLANERARTAEYHKLDKYKNKNFQFRLKEYGIDENLYNEKLEQQNNVCAICHKPDNRHRLCVDHNHSSGNVRGLLCHTCNRTLGVFNDDRKLFRSVISYLMKYESPKNWDEYFLDMANAASVKSKDPSTKVGAIIVRDNIIISTGFNGFPRGSNDTVSERYTRPLKYQWTIHAEENAIFNAAKSGAKLEGSTLYVTPLPPCSNCALSIVQAGIKEVVYRQEVENSRFADSIKQAVEILGDSGVLLRKFSNDELA